MSDDVYRFYVKVTRETFAELVGAAVDDDLRRGTREYAAHLLELWAKRRQKRKRVEDVG